MSVTGRMLATLITRRATSIRRSERLRVDSASMPELRTRRVGDGPRVVLVHASATDLTTWSAQLESPLRTRFELVAYDRRATPTVEDQAADLAHVIAGSRAIVVGSSFGAVVALELARSRRELCSALVLIEPPMSPSDGPLDLAVAAPAAFGVDTPARMASPAAFLDEFDRRVAGSGGPAAGEFYLRTVLCEAGFERIPRAFVERTTSKWAELRADSGAMMAYRPRYSELAAIDVPVLLLGGERSAPYFRVTLTALAAALPRARLEFVARAGHMLHAEAPERFAELLVGLADQLGLGHAGP